MKKRLQRKRRSVRRALYSALSTGVLLQAGSCTFEPAEVVSGLATSLLNSVVSAYVFNFFGLGGP